MKNLKKLYIATNLMIIKLGAEGEIGSQAPEVIEVMGVLGDIDGGVFDEKISINTLIGGAEDEES